MNNFQTIQIRNASLEDLDTLWKWGEENWELWSDEKYRWFSKQSLKKLISDPKDDLLLVAKEGEKLIGMLFIYNLRDWAFCVGAFIIPSFRSQGIGKMLLKEAEEKLSEKGVESITLLIDIKNIKGLHFWKKMGFYEGYKFFFMTKELQK